MSSIPQPLSPHSISPFESESGLLEPVVRLLQQEIWSDNDGDDTLCSTIATHLDYDHDDHDDVDALLGIHDEHSKGSITTLQLATDDHDQDDHDQRDNMIWQFETPRSSKRMAKAVPMGNGENHEIANISATLYQHLTWAIDLPLPQEVWPVTPDQDEKESRIRVLEEEPFERVISKKRSRMILEEGTISCMEYLGPIMPQLQRKQQQKQQKKQRKQQKQQRKQQPNQHSYLLGGDPLRSLLKG